ncbi:programmed cell death 1 ligand 1 isoform X2 [Betta splendens]|uniref:Programmed cell death 1 ligand 1 isoform X2 n=1 Tax=Betta splendens TaxID=158456 RepID=A0A9W2Y613_BETSP|nr:programmed cell death 1 ligand 1 isoform X2 [Betta splendens]
MDWTLLVVFQVLLQPSLSVLFTVEAERTAYNSQFGGDVVMGCRFQPKAAAEDSELRVTWHLISVSPVREVHQYQRGQQPGPGGAGEGPGRARLLAAELRDGWAKLQISSLRINDSGTYQCRVQTKEGADYKTMTLSVTAPYGAVTRSVERAARGDRALLRCQAEGHPRTAVSWRDGRRRALGANTTAVETPQGLFRVSSQIWVNSTEERNYTCGFTADGASATFHIPGDLPAAQKRHDAVIVLLSVGVVLGIVIAALLLYRRRRKGLQINKENEEERTTFSEDYRKENLRVFLNERYCDFQCAADVEQLHQRLRTEDDRPAELQALIPDAGEAVVLEGPPGSGKTGVAHFLVRSWALGVPRAPPPLLQLRALQLLLYLDCSAAEGDLCQELMARLGLKEHLSTEDELRTMLSRCGETLLLLDGYREGSARFDESLKRLLGERGGCRVLVTTSEDVRLLTEASRTARVLKLHTPIAKY